MKTILSIVCLFFTTISFAQDGTFKVRKADQIEVISEKMEADTEVFQIVQTSAQFPGGQEAYNKFIADNLSYPEEAKEQGISGTVYVSFIVDRTGNINNPKVLRSVHPLLDAEALRLINLLPQFTPGSNNGSKVNQLFNVPIRFILK